MNASTASGGIFDVPSKEARAAELERRTLEADFWSDQDAAQAVLKGRAGLLDVVAGWKKLAQDASDAQVYLELAETGDDEALDELERLVADLDAGLSRAELQRMLGGPHDALGAIATLRPGAGGQEAQDWADMLLRLYLRWAERRAYRVEVVDLLPGEGNGVKSATFTVEGAYAYGHLRAEAGIHRLVRISPFDGNARRHTSFASLFVYPDIDETVEVEVRAEDLRVDTYRASGAGGQHVNKTDSAIRLTHLPTGIVVQCQNERSQHRNRTTAMKILRARLYELELEKQRQRMEDLHKSKKDIAWGSQIRSYVLHPYRMVKDHRTGVEVGNTDAVLDGDIDRFIEAYLLQHAAAE